MKAIAKALVFLVAVLVTGAADPGHAFAGGHGKHQHRGHGNQGHHYQGGYKHHGGHYYGRKRHGGQKYGHQRHGYKRHYRHKHNFRQLYFNGYAQYYRSRDYYGHQYYYPPYYITPYRTVYAQPRARYIQPQVTYAQPKVDYHRPVPTEATLPPGCIMTREYQTRVAVGGKYVDAYGDACLQADGSWKRGPAKIVPD